LIHPTRWTLGVWRVTFTAVSFALPVLALYLIFVLTRRGQELDAEAFDGGAWIRESAVALPLAHVRTAVVIVLATVVLVVGSVALVNRRFRTVAVSVVLVAASIGVARLLRFSLGRPYLGDYAYRYNTFPSGHAAAAGSLAVAILLLLPDCGKKGPRTVAVLAITSGGCASVLTFAHRPSDISAGILLVGLIGALLVPLADQNVYRFAHRPHLVWPMVMSVLTLLLWLLMLSGVTGNDALKTLAPFTGTLACALWVVLAMTWSSYRRQPALPLEPTLGRSVRDPKPRPPLPMFPQSRNAGLRTRRPDQPAVRRQPDDARSMTSRWPTRRYRQD
jgi:membrane-associated phospholipid phosphatase